MTSFVYANAGQLPPPPTYIPNFSTIDAMNLSAMRAAQGAGSNPIQNPVALPAHGVITDIAEIPTLEEVTLRNFHEFDDKLKIYNPDPNLEYRWANSDGPRYASLYSAGYRPVTRLGIARTDNAGVGGARLRAGTERDGTRRDAILMARPKIFREMQNESYRKLINMNRQALDPKSFSGNNDTDNRSFRGQIVMQGR